MIYCPQQCDTPLHSGSWDPGVTDVYIKNITIKPITITHSSLLIRTPYSLLQTCQVYNF